MQIRPLATVAAAAGVAIGLTAFGANATALASGTGHAKAKTTESPWVLGSLVDETGEDAAGGAAQKAGIDYWAQQVNASGGLQGHKVQIKFCDTQSTPTAAAQCAQQLADVNTHVVLAQSIDPPTRGALPYLNKDLVVAVDPVLLPTSKQKNVFQATGSGLVVANALVQGAKAAGFKTIGVLYTTDTSGTNQLAAAKQAAQSAGLKVVDEAQTDGATDVTPQLVQLRSQGAQVIYLASVGTNTAAAVNSYKTLNMSQPLVVGAANVTNGFLSSLSSIPQNMYGVSQLLEDTSGIQPATAKAFQAYLKNFKAKMHEPADTQTTSAVYDGCVATSALQSAGTNLPALEKFLKSHTISCLGSDMKFDVQGLNVINGQPAALAKAGATASAGWGKVTGKI
jgi:branched-chain amino acid transport system substrate-binding protein